MPLPLIDPPLVNSANPWATSVEDLQALFDSPHTGAITTRTSLLDGFEHDPDIHQYTFFKIDDHTLKRSENGGGAIPASFGGSLNTLGYSPRPLSYYLAAIGRVVAESKLPDDVKSKKPFIISVTGSPDAVVECYRKIQTVQSTLTNPLCMELNLSCPNIPGKPPPAYSEDTLVDYLGALAEEGGSGNQRRVAVGIKTPPYTYHDQFKTLLDALLTLSMSGVPLDFITATNTLGSCLVMRDSKGTPALGSSSGMGIGGMGGAPLHPLALGNVKTIKGLIDQEESLNGIEIIGVGGVDDRSGFDRMQAAGAKVVGVGTALGREGIEIFEKILRGHST